MDGVLDAPRAELLVTHAIAYCRNEHPGVIVDVVVTWPGGKIMADATTAGENQRSRPHVVCDINNQAVRAQTDYLAIPHEWARRQEYAIGDAARLIGSVLRIYHRAGTAKDPNTQMVGVVGLLGIDAEHARAILTKAAHGCGLSIFSDLATDDKQGRA